MENIRFIMDVLHLKYNALIYYFHTFYLIWWIKDLHDIPIFPFCLLALYP